MVVVGRDRGLRDEGDTGYAVIMPFPINNGNAEPVLCTLHRQSPSHTLHLTACLCGRAALSLLYVWGTGAEKFI